MKTKLFSYVFLLLSTFSVGVAQESISVSESTANIEDANGNALRTEINRADEKMIIKAWKSLMKDYDGDVDIKGNNILSKEVIISAISERGITVYAQINKLSDTRKEFLVIFLNGDSYISSKNDISSYTAANQIVKDFAQKVSQNATNKHRDLQMSVMKDLTKQLENLKREQKNAEKEIEKAKETIKDKEYELGENEKEQTEMAKKIEQQKELVKNAKNEAELFE